MPKPAFQFLPVFFIPIFLPLFIVAGQLVMRFTGYTAWAAQAGQEFMLSFIFYLAVLGVLLGGRAVVLLQRLVRDSQKG